jgi:hypothetical protein
VPVSVVVDFEATIEEYDAVNEKMDARANPPEGLIVHTGADLGDGKIRVMDIWESAQAYGKFAETRLGPAIMEVVGPDAPQVQPQITELHDVIKG